MTAVSPESGINGSDSSGGSRASRRSRRIWIISALVLVVIGGALFVGAKVAGSRGGYLTTTLTCVKGGTTSWTTLGNDVTDVQYTFYDSNGRNIKGPVQAVYYHSFPYNTPLGAARVVSAIGVPNSHPVGGSADCK